MNTFLSADQLGISQELKDGLIWALDNLEKGTFTLSNGYAEEYAPLGFDMGTPAAGPYKIENGENNYECGTACCIAGWAAVKMNGLTFEKDGVRLNQATIDLAGNLINGATGAVDRLFMGEYLTDGGDEDWDEDAGALTLGEIGTTEAALATRSFLETGEAHWEVACPVGHKARE